METTSKDEEQNRRIKVLRLPSASWCHSSKQDHIRLRRRGCPCIQTYKSHAPLHLFLLLPLWPSPSSLPPDRAGFGKKMRNRTTAAAVRYNLDWLNYFIRCKHTRQLYPLRIVNKHVELVYYDFVFSSAIHQVLCCVDGKRNLLAGRFHTPQTGCGKRWRHRLICNSEREQLECVAIHEINVSLFLFFFSFSSSLSRARRLHPS